MIRIHLYIVFTLAVLLIASCQTYRDYDLQDGKTKLVVNALASVGEPFSIKCYKSILYSEILPDKESRSPELIGVDWQLEVNGVRIAHPESYKARPGDQVSLTARYPSLPTVHSNIVVPQEPIVPQEPEVKDAGTHQQSSMGYFFGSITSLGDNSIYEMHDYDLSLPLEVHPQADNYYRVVLEYSKPVGIGEKTRWYPIVIDDPIVKVPGKEGVGVEQFFEENNRYRMSLIDGADLPNGKYIVHQRISFPSRVLDTEGNPKTSFDRDLPRRLVVRLRVYGLSKSLYKYWWFLMESYDRESPLAKFFQEPSLSYTNIEDGMGILGGIALGYQREWTLQLR